MLLCSCAMCTAPVQTKAQNCKLIVVRKGQFVIVLRSAKVTNTSQQRVCGTVIMLYTQANKDNQTFWFYSSGFRYSNSDQVGQNHTSL